MVLAMKKLPDFTKYMDAFKVGNGFIWKKVRKTLR